MPDLPEKPNILFAIADDASHFGAYGHTWVKTPNFDRVCREGIRFTQAFTTNPKCAPSRASILTGRHTWQNRESCLHWNYWPDNLPVFPDMLEDAGYHVGYTGKPWGPGDWKRCGRKRNPAGTEYNDLNLAPPENTGLSPRDYAGNFDLFLEDRNADRPFYFWYGGHEPHRGYVFGEGAAHGKHPDEIGEVPPYWPDEENIRKDMLDYAYEIEWFDEQLGKMIRILEDRGELENTLIVVTSDNGCPFPRVKGQMYDDDFRLPLAAMWPQGISPGRVVDDIVSFIDFAPTFLQAAGAKIPDELPGTSLFDVFNGDESGTISEHRSRAYMGRERHDMGREGDLGYPVRCIRTHQHLYVRNFAPERWPAGNPETDYSNCDSSPTKTRIVELHDSGDERYWQLAFGKRPQEELYDVKADPYCLNNLALDSSNDELKNQLWSELKKTLEETGDPRIFGNGDVFEEYEYIVDAPHSWAHYLAGDWKHFGY